MELTQISPFGILILEPVTTLTDFIAASVAYFAFFILHKQKLSGPVHQLMKYYFLIMGIGLTSAAFIGHAFQYLLTPDWKAIGWIGSSMAILVLILASVEYIRPVLGGNKCRIIQMLALIQISLFLLALSIPGIRSFETVKLNSAIGPDRVCPADTCLFMVQVQSRRKWFYCFCHHLGDFTGYCL